jgi:GntR family transcriptional repressor for pyruvate dehydrogenase complex
MPFLNMEFYNKDERSGVMLNPLERTPVTEEALERVKELITAGKITIGEKLPPEYELAAQLGISRPSIREVLITLQAEGYIEIKRGKGAYVMDKDQFDKKKFMEWFQNNEFRIQELLEARMAIEPMAASLAAERITEAELDGLEKNYNDFVVAIKNHRLDEIVLGDEKFHELIIRASSNELLYFLYSNFIPAMREYRRRAFSPPANPYLATEWHRRIIEALKTRNPNDAFQSMLGHLKDSQTDIRETAQTISSTHNEP